MMERLDDKQRFTALSKLEVPDPGYTGSLKGTSWDPDEILQGYEQGEIGR